ncbi:Ig-like domain-containing protein [Methanobrevibacter arboriphilus]|uniref:Ig-like domain-containing protein n=1 Tax=Methanobrevibacter arboriphilus TaxID=39441 RepID=UPI0006D255C6|nr:Ig-like domain-containing protein [Methanobrevibacter arboriphilus]
MKINKVIIIFLLIISLFSGVVIASEVSAAENNIYVSLSGDDSSGNGSSDNPYNSIGKAINQSTDSDKNIIYLDEGIYKGDNNTKIEISKFHKNQEGSISIIGKGVDKTYIDGSSISYLFNISSNSIVYLHNLTILNCTNINGGAIVNYGTLTITNCNFENNTAAERGGAIWNNGMLKLKNNTMNNCFASTEGGHYIYNNGSIDTVKLTLLKNETIKIIKGDISLYVLVTDDKGNNISGGNFTFLLGDERFNAIVTEGLAKYDLSITTLGKYLLSGEYYSNYTKGNLISIYTSEILVVKNTSININSVNGKRGLLFNLIATLKDEEGNPISDKVVKFYVNNVYIGNSITNVNGIAKFSYISYSYGKLIVKTVFEGG